MDYKNGKIAQQIIALQHEDGQWDLGPKAKDNVYFPLSDSWRTAEARKADCTAKISAILKKLRV